MTGDIGTLIERCIAGDAEARAVFCSEYYDLVGRAIFRRLATFRRHPPARADIDDIRQDVFARLLDGPASPLTRLRQPHSLDAWLVTMAGNQAIDHFRRHDRITRTHEALASEPIAITTPAPDHDVIAQERMEHIRRALAELPSLDRLILDFYFVHGLRYAEIAEILNLNINTLSARLRRAKAKLRAMLEENADELV